MAFDWAGVIDHSKRNARSNVLLLESTYGDRLHEVDGTRVQFADAIRGIAHRGGSVLIPAFSVDRTEVILTELAQLRNTGETPDLPIVLDSPMALACLRVHRGPLADGWPEERTAPILDEALDPDRLIEVTDDAAGSGPADRGHRRYRVRQMERPADAGDHHLCFGQGSRRSRAVPPWRMLPNHRHTVAVVGFVPGGHPAGQLVDGARELKIHGRSVPVRAEIIALDAFSDLADANELVAWATAAPAPDTCYVVYGEERSSQALAARLQADSGWLAVVRARGERVL